MKNIIIIIVCLVFCSCNGIYGEFEEISRGLVTEVDSCTNKISIENNGNVESFWLSDLEVKPDDYVFVYQNGDTFSVNKADLMTARSINSTLTAYADGLFKENGIMLLVLLACGLSLLFYFLGERLGVRLIWKLYVPLAMAGCFFFAGYSSWTVGAKLKYQSSGKVTNIVGNLYTVAVTNEGDSLPKTQKMKLFLSSPFFIDTADKHEIAKGDDVFLYLYTRGGDYNNVKGVFALSRRLGEDTVRLDAMYPQSALKLIGVLAAMFMVTFMATALVVAVIRKRKK